MSRRTLFPEKRTIDIEIIRNAASPPTNVLQDRVRYFIFAHSMGFSDSEVLSFYPGTGMQSTLHRYFTARPPLNLEEQEK
jgi:hypothetical protein